MLISSGHLIHLENRHHYLRSDIFPHTTESEQTFFSKPRTIDQHMY